MAEEDTYILKLVSRIGAILGQFPVRTLKNGLLRVDILSPIGIWSIFLFLYNLIVLQTMIALSTFQREVGSIPLEGFDVRGTSILSAMNSVYLCASYSVYIFWLFSLPKFLTAWNALISYDEKYPLLKQQRRPAPAMLIFKVIQAGFLWIETIMSALSFKFSVNYIDGHAQLDILTKLSWIARFFSMSTIGTLLALHMGIIEFASGLAILFILELSRALKRRIEMIQNVLRNPLSTKQIEICINQVKEIMEIFESCRSASNLIITTFLSFSAILITGYVFIIIINKDLIGSSVEFAPFAVYALIYFLFAVFKVFMLTNSGESIMQKGIQLRRTIIKISSDLFIDSVSLTNLKFLALDIDFQLSGLGYFKLNRAALTGILSSVITYNVVLAQFQASAERDNQPF